MLHDTLRTWALVIKATRFDGTVLVGRWEEALWHTLDICRAAEEKHTERLSKATNDHHADSLFFPLAAPPALAILEMRFPSNDYGDVPIIRRLCSEEYTVSLTSALRVLRIHGNTYDESADLGALNALPLLMELRVDDAMEYGLTSLRRLQGCSPALQRLIVSDMQELVSLEGVEESSELESVDASRSAITSLRPLLQGVCRHTLRQIVVAHCPSLTSLAGSPEGKEDEDLKAVGCPHLADLVASYALISSLRPLHACPALSTLTLYKCIHLQSLDGLQGCSQLTKVDVSWTLITNVRALEGSRRSLRKLSLCGCRHLSSVEGLEGHMVLEELDASWTALTSLAPLRLCTALATLFISRCAKLHPAEIVALEEALPNVETING